MRGQAEKIFKLNKRIAELEAESEKLAEQSVQLNIEANTAADNCVRMRKQLAEAQKDAARYRWLRDVGDKFADSLTSRWMMDATRVDEVIDAAMESE